MKSKPIVMDHFSTVYTSYVLIAGETGKLIVIDNADILLDDDTRKYILENNTNGW